jgi:hypothetical protein
MCFAVKSPLDNFFSGFAFFRETDKLNIDDTMGIQLPTLS